MVNNKFSKLITCAIVGICVYKNNMYSMDKMYSNDNSIKQISNNNDDILLNAESYSNVKFTETLNEIFKSDEWFNFKPKKEWPGQYNQAEADRYAKYVYCKESKSDYETEFTNSYDEITQQYTDNYSDNLINDVVWIFRYTSEQLSIENPYQYPEEYWQENTFVSADILIKYKQLFDKCISNNNVNNSIQNALVQAMEKYISNINISINDKYISVYDLYYYIRNKLLQVGINIVQNLNTTGNYKTVTEINKNTVVNCLSTVQNIFNNLTKDLYSSENIITKQINKKEIKDMFDGMAISLDKEGRYLFIPYLSYKGLLNHCNYQINQLYKKYYHELISSKVNKLHSKIIKTLDKVLSENKSKIEVEVKGKTYHGLGDNILRNNIYSSKYYSNTLNDKFSDGKTMSLENYLQESKAYIEFIKGCYDDQIKLLYGEVQYSNEMNKYFEEQYSKSLQEEQKGKLHIVKCDNSYSDKNLDYEFNSYTEDYIDIVKHLLGNILKENKIKIPTLEKLLQQIEKSKKEIIDGEIL